MRVAVKRGITVASIVVAVCVVLPVLLWFGFPYTSYRIYMAWLASGVVGGYGSLPEPLVRQLDARYAHDLVGARYAHTSRLPTSLAVADCATVYFGSPDIVADLREGAPLTERRLRWLSHELTHGEQCQRWGGRAQFARTWFSQANAQAWRTVRDGRGWAALGEWFRTRYIRDLHDAMPMEIEADARAREVLDAAP